MNAPAKVLNRTWYVDAAALSACVLLTAALYFTMIHPLARQKARREAQEVELAAVRLQAADKAAALGAVQTQLAHTRRELEATPLRLQSFEIINQRLAALTDLANDGGIKLDQVQPGQPVMASRYDVAPIRLAGVGSYEGMAAFLHKLHEQFGDTGVRSFKLVAREKDNVTTAHFAIDLAWYTAPAPRKLGPDNPK